MCSESATQVHPYTQMLDLVYASLGLIGASVCAYVVIQLLTGGCEVVCH